jgi:uncharacterized protein (TIGR00299 family) protein
MRIAYFDCFSGISGTMALSALLHAGADIERVSAGLDALPSARIELEREDTEIRGITAAHVDVRSHASEVVWTYSSIRSMLDEADIPGDARRTAQRAFRLLADAEARVQGREADLVTFYDAGEPDVLVAIVGTALCLQQLEIERVFASAVPIGMGMARHEHGMVPIPSPVVVELLKGAPTFSRGIPIELVTPAGAALLAAVVEGYGELPMMRTERVGYGAGQLRLDFPNVLRVMIGEEVRPGAGPEEVLLLQCRMHEAGPQSVPTIMGELFDAGAVDAWMTPIIGPDGEPAMTVSVVAPARTTRDVKAVLQARAGATTTVRISRFESS